VLASFFVIAVYIWKPIYQPPYDTKKLSKLTSKQLKQVTRFEIKMRSQSVGTLCFFSLMAIILAADHSKRPQVHILQWFGLHFNTQVLRFTVSAIALNSVLYMGEIYQMIRGMVTTEYELDILCFKNIVVAPLFEEFIYRICLINMFMEAQALTER
jgi:hypothetical protein